MGASWEAEISAAIDNDVTLGELLTRDTIVVDDTLASFLGLTPPGSQQEVSGEGNYGGLLRHPSVLVAHSKTEILAPILRGKVVRERMLCQPIPAPPANAASQQEELLEDENETDPRLLSDARLNAETCSGCHQLMDPIGFGFANADLVGRARDTDENGETISSAGSVSGTSAANGDFTGVAELQAQLADSSDVAGCWQSMWLEFGTGVNDAELACAVDPSAQTNELRPRAGLTSSTRTPHFVIRRGEEGALDGLVADALPLVFNGEIVGPDTIPDPGLDPDPDPDPAPNPTGPVPVIPDVFPDSVTVTAFQNLPADDWGTGYCVRFTFDVSEQFGDWTMPLDVEGMINTSWNVSRDGDSGTVNFSGEGFTANLAPGLYEDVLGYCADR